LSRQGLPQGPDGRGIREGAQEDAFPLDQEVHQRGYPKICAACGGSPTNLAADHVVPLKIISQMPGFACLSLDDQKKIANEKENFVGLCTSCNSSKRDKLWARWKGVKSANRTWSDSLRREKQLRTNDRMVNLKAKIRAAPCK
jgi:5-methylcytosine-specific restriction endonuclease McrA